jgi:hypothetical protein
MSAEPEFNAYVKCSYCNDLKPRREVIDADSRYVCADDLCRDAHHLASLPRPVPKSQSRFEHG